MRSLGEASGCHPAGTRPSAAAPCSPDAPLASVPETSVKDIRAKVDRVISFFFIASGRSFNPESPFRMDRYLIAANASSWLSCSQGSNQLPKTSEVSIWDHNISALVMSQYFLGNGMGTSWDACTSWTNP